MSSGDSDWLPTLDELERAPELAILASLDSTLEMTACVLQVAHPELARDEECPYWVCGSRLIVAERVLSLVERLRDALFRYQELALGLREPSSLHLYDPDDLPF